MESVGEDGTLSLEAVTERMREVFGASLFGIDRLVPGLDAAPRLVRPTMHDPWIWRLTE